MSDCLTLVPPECKVMSDWLTPGPPECKVMSDCLTPASPECKVMPDWLTPAPPQSKVVSDWLKILVTSPKHWFFVWRGRENGGRIQIFWFFWWFGGRGGWKSSDFLWVKAGFDRSRGWFWSYRGLGAVWSGRNACWGGIADEGIVRLRIRSRDGLHRGGLW